MTDSPTTIAPANDQPPEAAGSVMGHNSPPGLLDADALTLKLNGTEDQPGLTAKMDEELTRLLAEIGGRVDGIPGVPAVIETAKDNGLIAGYMARLRESSKVFDRSHDLEKAPYLAAGRVVDNHYKTRTDKIDKTKEILQKRGDAYTARLVAEERQRRQKELADAAEAERLAAAERQRLLNEAAAAAAAAERARKPENVAKHEERAEIATIKAASAEIDHMMATSEADNAALRAAAPSAAIARTRHESGNLSTAQQVGYCEIIDKTKLDFARLLPFIREDVLLAALKACAKIEGHKVPMDGAIIEMRDKASYR